MCDERRSRSCVLLLSTKPRKLTLHTAADEKNGLDARLAPPGGGLSLQFRVWGTIRNVLEWHSRPDHSEWCQNVVTAGCGGFKRWFSGYIASVTAQSQHTRRFPPLALLNPNPINATLYYTADYKTWPHPLYGCSRPSTHGPRLTTERVCLTRSPTPSRHPRRPTCLPHTFTYSIASPSSPAEPPITPASPTAALPA